MARWTATLLLVCTTLLHHLGGQAGEVRVAVAANFAAPMKALSAQFERDTGHRVRAAYGSTGALYAQIRHGAPFDILLAADTATPQRLEAEGSAVPGTRFTYAQGALVLWSPQPGRVDAAGEVLRRGAFQRIALANPKLSPYGAAAVEVMTCWGVVDALRPRWVLGDHIGQAHQFVASGNAELGFVARSHVLAEGLPMRGSAWVVPQSWYTPLRQDAVLLRSGSDSVAALSLMAYLKGEAARAVIAAHGYTW